MPGPVAYILLWFPEPTQTFVLDEVNTLVMQGLEVRVFTLYGPQSRRRLTGLVPSRAPITSLGPASLVALLRSLREAVRNGGRANLDFLRGVVCRRWRSLETAGEALWAVLAGVHLARVFKEQGISHLHAPWADGPATAAWVASRLSGIPFSFCAHAHDIYPPDGALAEKLTAAAWVRVISAANRQYLAGLAPGAADRLVVIPIGVPLLPEAPRAPRPAPPFRLLSLGRLVDKKGFPVLLQACRLLLDQGLDLRLTLAGDGPRRRPLRRLAARLGLQARVSFPGFVPHAQVPALLREAHLFVLPCRVDVRGDRDGIPTVILEALAHGLPVVSTAVSGIPEAVRPGETGWLAPPDDPAALARCIQEALADPAEAVKRGRAGQDLVAREFDSRKNYARLAACLASAGWAGEGPCPG